MTSGCALTTARAKQRRAIAGRAPRASCPGEWIDPDEHAIGAKQLLANLVREVLVIDGRLGMDADCGELFENAVKAVVLRRRGLPRFEIATPKYSDSNAFLGHH